MNSPKDCNRCGGSGTIYTEIEYQYDDDGKCIGEIGGVGWYITCPNCGGSGEVDDD